MKWNLFVQGIIFKKMNFEYVLCLSLTIFCKTKFGWIIYKDDLYFLASLTLSRKSKLNIYRAHMNFWLVLASDGKWFHRYSSNNGTNVECRLRLFRLWFHVQRNRVWMCFVLTYGQSILRAKERERERMKFARSTLSRKSSLNIYQACLNFASFGAWSTANNWKSFYQYFNENIMKRKM